MSLLQRCNPVNVLQEGHLASQVSYAVTPSRITGPVLLKVYLSLCMWVVKTVMSLRWGVVKQWRKNEMWCVIPSAGVWNGVLLTVCIADWVRVKKAVVWPSFTGACVRVHVVSQLCFNCLSIHLSSVVLSVRQSAETHRCRWLAALWLVLDCLPCSHVSFFPRSFCLFWRQFKKCNVSVFYWHVCAKFAECVQPLMSASILVVFRHYCTRGRSSGRVVAVECAWPVASVETV